MRIYELSVRHRPWNKNKKESQCKPNEYLTSGAFKEVHVCFLNTSVLCATLLKYKVFTNSICKSHSMCRIPFNIKCNKSNTNSVTTL